jgi:DNA-binding response OmpR family regulator
MAASKSVLLISNAVDLRLNVLAEHCKSQRLKLVLAQDANSGRAQIEAHGLSHLVIIDLNLPDQEGEELCRELTGVAGLPMIVIGDAHETAMSPLDALLCADDYVRRQEYSVEELTARIVRVLSRAQSFEYGGSRQIQMAESLQVDLVGHQVIANKEQRALTPTENALLSVLLVHRGHMVDGRTLVDRVWPFDTSDYSFNALRVHMHRLRNKLEGDPQHPRFITTDRGIGYRFQG